MNPGTRLLLLLATLALVALCAGPLTAADTPDDDKIVFTAEAEGTFSPWPIVGIILFVAVALMLFMAKGLDDNPKFLIIGIAVALLLGMCLTLLPWGAVRTWGTEEDWETGTEVQTSMTFQFGLTYFYFSENIEEEKAVVWKWHDRETFDMIFESENGDTTLVPIALVLLALVAVVVAVVTGLMGSPAARYLIVTYAALSLLAGLYFMGRAMMEVSESGDSLFSYASENNLTKMTYLGLGWLSATVIVPLLGLWMFFIADAVGGEVTTISESGMTLSGVAGAPRAARRWEEDGGSLFGRDGHFAHEAEAEEEYVPAAPPYGAAPTVVTPTVPAPTAPAYGAPQAATPPAGAQVGVPQAAPSSYSVVQPAPSASAAPTAAPPSGPTISCPSCAHSFAVTPAGGPQQVTCPACGTSGTMQL